MRGKPGSYQKAKKWIKSEEFRCNFWPIVSTQSTLVEQTNTASNGDSWVSGLLSSAPSYSTDSQPPVEQVDIYPTPHHSRNNPPISQDLSCCRTPVSKSTSVREGRGRRRKGRVGMGHSLVKGGCQTSFGGPLFASPCPYWLSCFIRCCRYPRRHLIFPTWDASSQLKICINKLCMFHWKAELNFPTCLDPFTLPSVWFRKQSLSRPSANVKGFSVAPPPPPGERTNRLFPWSDCRYTRG